MATKIETDPQHISYINDHVNCMICKAMALFPLGFRIGHRKQNDAGEEFFDPLRQEFFPGPQPFLSPAAFVRKKAPISPLRLSSIVSRGIILAAYFQD